MQSETLGQQENSSLQFQGGLQEDNQAIRQDTDTEDESVDQNEYNEERRRILSEMYHIERKFYRAKKQVILLNNRIRPLIVRYFRARDQERMSFKFTIKHRCTILEGVRDMYFEYAKKLCLDMDELKESLRMADGDEYDIE